MLASSGLQHPGGGGWDGRSYPCRSDLLLELIPLESHTPEPGAAVAHVSLFAGSGAAAGCFGNVRRDISRFCSCKISFFFFCTG